VVLAGLAVCLLAALLPLEGGRGPVAGAAGAFEKGVNISFYDSAWRPDSFVATQSATYARYFADDLGATTVTVTVPLWVTSTRSNKVLSGLDPTSKYASTPTPERLRILVDALRAKGLEVRVRPLINEGGLAREGAWRGKITPNDPDKWFASYRRAIRPMLDVAVAGGASSFVVQVELQKLGADPRWADLISWVHGRFSGNVVWNSVWGLHGGAGYAPHPTTRFAIDPYPIVHLPGKATVEQLVGGWASFLDANPLPAPAQNTLLQEVGILASANIYSQPWLHANPTGRFSTRTQVRWFAAACAFAHRFGFRGISYNSFFLTSPILATDDPSQPQLIQPEGAAAIKACFQGS
jgi:hypothetical protein